MERKTYQLTEKQMKKVAYADYAEAAASIPSDDEIKDMWKKAHHGKVTGWGMKKATLIENAMTATADYQRGLWQGRVDKANGLPYSEERNENLYNLGYYRGYDEYESNRRGWDAGTRDWFDQNWVNN